MRITNLALFVVTSLVTGGVFWVLYGSHLTYDVGSGANGGYTFSHTEDFSTSGRIIISSLVAILAGGLLTGIWHLIQKILSEQNFRKTTK